MVGFSPALFNKPTKGSAGGTPTPTPPPGWTPSTPSNTLVEWLEPDSIGLSDGTAITTWTANAGKNATGSGSTRPLYKTGIKNGHNIVRFDGVDDTMATIAFTVEQTPPYTTMIVFKYSNTTGVQFLQDGIDAVKRATIFVNGGTLQVLSGASTGAIATADTSWHILLIEWNGASSNYQLDGGTLTTLGSLAGTANFAGITLGTNQDGAFGPASVDVGDVILWTGILSSGDKTSAFSWANTKWAVY